MGSWVAVEPNGMRLSSMFNPMGLGALLPPPPRALLQNKRNNLKYQKVSTPSYIISS